MRTQLGTSPEKSLATQIIGKTTPENAPAFSSAEIGTVNSYTVVVTFDIDISASDYLDGVTIQVNGITQSIVSATRQANHAIVHYVIDDGFYNDVDVFTWAYSQVAGNIVSEADNTPLANVSAQSIINNEEIMKVAITLDNDQIKALPTTPVEIVAAPGENKLILPLFAVMHMNWVADYENINATANLIVDVAGFLMSPLSEDTISMVSQFLAGGGPDGAWAITSMHKLAKATTTTATPSVNPHYHIGVGDSGWYDSDVANKPLQISIDNRESGNLTAGNAANTLTVTVVYVVVDLS